MGNMLVEFYERGEVADVKEFFESGWVVLDEFYQFECG